MLLSGTENHFPIGVLALTALRQTVETEKKNVSSVRFCIILLILQLLVFHSNCSH